MGSVLASVVALIAVSVVLAQGDLGGKIRSGGDVRVPAGETHAGDLYAFGGSITIDGTIDGDLVAAGGQVTVGGNVTGDLLATGGMVRVDGEVTGDVRAAAGQVTLAGAAGEDALLTAGQVEMPASATVGEDVILAAGQANLAGSIVGSITGWAGAYSRTGTLGGTDEVVIPPDDPPRNEAVDRAVDGLQQYVAALIVGLIGLLVAPRILSSAGGAVRREPLVAAGWGLLAFVGFIVALIVIGVAMVIFGAGLAAAGLDVLAGLVVGFGVLAIIALALAFGLTIGFLADVVVALAIAWFVARRSRAESVGPGLDLATIVAFAIGLAIVVLLSSIVVIGPWVKLAVVLLGMGALVLVLWRLRRGSPGPRQPATPAPAL